MVKKLHRVKRGSLFYFVQEISPGCYSAIGNPPEGIYKMSRASLFPKKQKVLGAGIVELDGKLLCEIIKEKPGPISKIKIYINGLIFRIKWSRIVRRVAWLIEDSKNRWEDDD